MAFNEFLNIEVMPPVAVQAVSGEAVVALAELTRVSSEIASMLQAYRKRYRDRRRSDPIDSPLCRGHRNRKMTCGHEL